MRKVASDEFLLRNKKSFFGFCTPLSYTWFSSVVGAEYCHTYFWIAKDLAWMQGARHESIFFGLLALSWSLLVMYHSMRTVNWHELWNFLSLFMWLFASYWWMIGETHDYDFPDEFPVASEYADTSAIILTVALVWELCYYLVILPCNLIPISKAALIEYDEGQLQPRFHCFKNFREYENLHMLFWIAKDLAWNRQNILWWAITLVPTILLSVDFIIISIRAQCADFTVDIVHFSAILFWVVGNSMWACGFDEPLFLWTGSSDSWMTARWYASWILVVSILPIVCMYAMWIYLTLTKRLEAGRQGVLASYSFRSGDALDELVLRRSGSGSNLHTRPRGLSVEAASETVQSRVEICWSGIRRCIAQCCCPPQRKTEIICEETEENASFLANQEVC